MSLSDALPLSALQHWLFCPRQCALIHVERLWAENRLTAEGRVLHERADEGHSESRDGIRILRSVHVASSKLGVQGVADVVEMRPNPFPVEYKRGRPKAHRADEVQLCAQAICLEEMTGVSIPEGALFYGKNRRRKAVVMGDALRNLTQTVAAEAHAAVEGGILPRPVFDAKRCTACSLSELCRPEAPRDAGADWMACLIARAAVPD